MPRIVSIARSSPDRSSVVKCCDTSGNGDAAVSVAIYPFPLYKWRRPGSPGGRDSRAGGISADSPGKCAAKDRQWLVSLAIDDGRVGVLAASAVADARCVAMARVRGAD